MERCDFCEKGKEEYVAYSESGMYCSLCEGCCKRLLEGKPMVDVFGFVWTKLPGELASCHYPLESEK